jgi:predicted ATPase with chaperone activity
MFARRKGLWWEYFSIAGRRLTIIVFSELDVQMSSRHIKKHCQIDMTPRNLLESAIDKLGLSARAFDRILKIARAIADL